jgi:hypothetical protein
MKEKICPKIKDCDVPMTKECFQQDCIGDWRECFLNCSKLPSEWLKEELKKIG